ncbi:MAG: caspase family protein [Alphaproteobacteria bacterium]|nr:caspase family protein [Alphaproteobacteria bacterium]
MNIRCFFLLLSMLLVGMTGPSYAGGERFALVIGNAAYPDAEAPLKEPVNDAKALSEALKRNGFTVDLGVNLGGDAMRKAFDHFYDKVTKGSVALVFFSGYGIQSGRQSFMIPIDAKIWKDKDVRSDGISLESVLTELNNRRAGVKVALIDASRRNPYERRFRDASTGLAPVDAPSNSLVMYSTATNTVSPDRGGDRGLFVQQLLREIGAPVTAVEVFERTKLGVIRASDQAQTPVYVSSLQDEFSFAPRVNNPPQNPPPLQYPDNRPTTNTTTTNTGGSAQSSMSGNQSSMGGNQTPIITEEPTETRPVEPNYSDDDPEIARLTAQIERDGNDFTALYRRGQLFAQKKAYAAALRDFDRVLRTRPNDVEALNNRCWIHTVIDQLADARKDCNNALRLRPNFADALDSRGLLNLKSNMPRRAIVDFTGALQLNPNLATSLYGRGLALKRTGAAARGAVDIANAKTRDPNIEQEYADYGVH